MEEKAKVKLAFLLRIAGYTLTAFMIIIYHIHSYILPDVSIEAIRYEASTLSAAIALLAFSLGEGIASLCFLSDRKSSLLVLISAVTIILGYVFPCSRLWVLGYMSALTITVIIGVIQVVLIISSLILLKLK